MMKEKLKCIIPPILFLTVTFCLYGPINLYYGNQNELWFSFSFIKGTILLTFFVTFLILTCLCFVLPKTISKVIIAFFFGLAFALWFEGTFMPMDYGKLDGSYIEWSAFKFRMIYDLIIWFFCIATPVVFIFKKEKITIKGIYAMSILLTIMQVISLSFMISSLGNAKNTPAVLTDEGKYTVSSKNNIIVLILDSFDNKLFERIIKDNPEYNQIFGDFTYYRNVVASFNYTFLAIPHILTGIAYDNSVPYPEYISNVYAKNSLLETLYQNNYDIRLFTYSNMLPLANPEVSKYISNQYDINSVEVSRVADIQLLSSLMYQFAATRYFPVILKKYVWFYSDEFESAKLCKTDDVPFAYLEKQSRDLNFYKAFSDKGFEVIDEKNAFRFYHLKGAHYPYNLNEDLKLVDEEYTSESFYSQAKASIKIAHAFIEELKKVGVYENATIIIAGDHGRIFNRRMAVDYMAPLLLVKTPGKSNNYLAVSNAPVCNGDIANTILSMLDNTSRSTGPSILDISENEKRKRYYYASSHLEKSRKEGYSQDLYEYVVDGDANKMSDWKSTGRILTPEGVILWEPVKYELGTKITFEDGAEGYKWVKEGLLEGNTAVAFTRKAGFAYTTSDKTEFAFNIGEVNNDISLIMEIEPVHTMEPQRFRFAIMVNGIKIEKEYEFLSSDGMKKVTFDIPRQYLEKSRTLSLTLLHPDAIQGQDMIIPYKQAFVLHSLVLNSNT